jgi:hypothetical protein
MSDFTRQFHHPENLNIPSASAWQNHSNVMSGTVP